MRLRLLGFALGLCFFTACSGGSGNSGSLRFVQASPNAPAVAVYDGRNAESGNLSYGSSTGYFSYRSGDPLRVYPANGSNVLFQASPSIISGGNETLVLTGPIASPTSILLTDGGTTAITNAVNVRVVNASAALTPPPDVYIVAANTSIAGVSPTVSGLAFNSSPGYVLVPTGTYEVVITTAGTKNALLDTGPIDLTSGNQTVIALDGTSGGFTFSLLTDQ